MYNSDKMNEILYFVNCINFDVLEFNLINNKINLNNIIKLKLKFLKIKIKILNIKILYNFEKLNIN